MARAGIRALVVAMLALAVEAQAEPFKLLAPPLVGGQGQPNELVSFISEDAPESVPLTEGLVPMTHEPRWTAWVGAIMLERAQPSSQALVISDTNETLFNADQIGFFLQAGPDVNALYHGDAFDVDFRWFQVNQAGAIDSMASAQVDEFLNLHTPVFLDDSPVDFNYTTSIQSVELNLRKNYTERVSFLAGFRYISLRDDLGAGFFPPGGAPWTTVHMVGINRMYGAQIGSDVILLDGGRWQIQWASKAGIYGNGAESLGTRVTPQTSNASNSVSRDMTSFVGDMSFSGIYAINDHWALRGGYQLLWLSGVALGSDQYATNAYTYAADASVADGSLFMHGALASVQFSW